VILGVPASGGQLSNLPSNTSDSSEDESSEGDRDERFCVNFDIEDGRQLLNENNSDIDNNDMSDDEDVSIGDMLMAEELGEFIDQMFEGFDYDDLRHIQRIDISSHARLLLSILIITCSL
jgi:hypothetical protein